MDLFGLNLEFQGRMEPFGDKSFYDIESSELKEFWDTDLDTGIGDALKVDDDWGSSQGFLDVRQQVVLNDRLMSDAAVLESSYPGPPIKSEHSYCTRLFSPDEDSSSDSRSVSLQRFADDMDDDCYPEITLKLEPQDDDDVNDPLNTPIIMIKDEPMSEEDSPHTSRSTSPSTASVSSFRFRTGEKRNAKCTKLFGIDAEKKNSGAAKGVFIGNIVGKRSGLSQQSTRLIMPHLNVKLNPNSAGFVLPPTPPSSTSSDSEAGNVSPERSGSSPTRRIIISATSRQPIQTPLISSQPKGSTGVLILTEEEKRTLLAEGYPIPTRLPLSKAEEKSLKKIRRKIKNKISAQESRRKKKEYMDALERKVETLATQNTEYKRKIADLEETNSSLLSQLQELQQIVGLQSLQSSSPTKQDTTAVSK